MMKHILSALVLVLTMATAMAVQYEGATGSQGNMITYRRTDADLGWQFNNGVFEFTSQYIWTDLATRIDMKETSSIRRGYSDLKDTDIVEFGYYKIGGDSQAMLMFQRNDAGELTAKNSVIFEGGDKIGIYAKIQEEKKVTKYEHIWNGEKYYSDSKNSFVDENGIRHNSHNGKKVTVTESSINTYTTTNTNAAGLEGASVVTNNVDRDSRGEETQYFCLFTDGFGAVDHFEYYLAHVVTGDNYNDFIQDVIGQNTDENGNPISTIVDSNGQTVSVSGQPLPGLLVSLCIGGIATGVGVSKKRKKGQKA